MGREKPAFATTSFKDLFASVKPHDKKALAHEINRVRCRNGFDTNHTTGFCEIDVVAREYHNPCTIEPSKLLWDFLRTKMLTIGGDQIYFRVFVFEDGTSRVYAKYGQIVGSRLLAEFDAAETRRFLAGVP